MNNESNRGGPAVLTVLEAALAAGVSPLTIYRWIDTGKISAEKRNVGSRGKYFVDAESLDQHLSYTGQRAER